jgi:molybdenum cofactor cytidylyltransferase
MPNKVCAILLAAGISSRMGSQNKLSLKIGGDSMFAHALTELRNSDVDEIIIVTNEKNLIVVEPHISPDDHIVLNPDFALGLTTSIQKGVMAVSAEVQGYMICMSDQPLLQAEHYNQLLNAFQHAYQADQACMAVPYYQGMKGNPVVFAASYQKEILAHNAMNGCKDIIRRHAAHRVQVHMKSDAVIRDVDTPEDYDLL